MNTTSAPAHRADLVLSVSERNVGGEIAGRKLLHRISHAHDRAHHAEGDAEQARSNESQDSGGDAEEDIKHRAVAVRRQLFHGGILLVGVLDDAVDHGAMRGVGVLQLRIDALGRSGVLGLEGRQELVGRLPELLHLGVGLGHQRRFQVGREAGGDPERLALVVVLAELDQTFAVGRQLVRLAHGQRRLEIGLDDIFRRRQNVRDEVVAELDVGVERTADLELFQGIEAGRNHGGKTDGENDAERNDRRGQGQTKFHETIRGGVETAATLDEYGKYGIASRRNCIARTPHNYGNLPSSHRYLSQRA
ncbi:hypothetical protein ABH988_001234 [Bradyrhizobium ottawaense]